MYSVRSARSEDAMRLTALMSQLGYEVAAPVLRERLERRDDLREVLVAESDGSVVGWIGIRVETTFVEGFGADLEGLVVDESVRSRGIGKLLLEAAESWARERGCSEMRVRSNVLRERAHSFYERQGYSTIKAQFNFPKTALVLGGRLKVTPSIAWCPEPIKCANVFVGSPPAG